MRRLAEHQLVVERHRKHAEAEIVMAARDRTVGQVGVTDRHVAIRDGANAVVSRPQQPAALHLMGDAEAIAGDAGNVGFGAADAIGRGLYFRDQGIADPLRLKRAGECKTPLGRQLDRHAEQALAAHLTPLVETIFSSDVVSREADHDVLAYPLWPAGPAVHCYRAASQQIKG